MKQIFENKIVTIDDYPHDNRFRFLVPEKSTSTHAINMAQLLEKYKNNDLDYTTNPRLWNEVYSPKKEREIFQELVEKTLGSGKKIHIENLSLAEELEYIQELYMKLGYFSKELNAFVVDFANCPITVGVNIRNFFYSFKDYYALGKSAFFVPPPREPRHQKAIRAGLNSGIISAIHLNPEDEKKEKWIIRMLLLEEKTNLLKLWQVLYFNLEKIGYELTPKEWIIEL